MASILARIRSWHPAVIVNQTPLHETSTNGHLNVFEILLDDGADMNAKTNAQSTPLHGASEGGHLEVVRTLLERGADVRLRNRKNRRALEVVTTSGRLAERSEQPGK
jgi:ankyrin repeat protein